MDETETDKQIREEMQGKTQTGGGAADPKAINHVGHMKMFEEMVTAINEGRPSMLDGHEGRRSVEVICAIYESAKTGQIISLNQQ